MQAAPIEGFATRVVGRTTICCQSAARDIVVIADRAGGRRMAGRRSAAAAETDRRRRAAQRRRLRRRAGSATLVERGVRELEFSRERLFGSAPEALAVGDSRDRRARNQRLGRGRRADGARRAAGADRRAVGRRDDRRVCGDTGPRRAGAAADRGAGRAAVAAGSLRAGDSRRAKRSPRLLDDPAARSVASWRPDDGGGRNARAAALPVRLGPGGILKVETPALSASARVALDNAMLL